MGPEPVLVGTVIVSELALATLLVARVPPRLTRVAPATVSKFVPVTVTVVPAGPILGVKSVIVGGERPAPETTVKGLRLVAVLAPTVTETGPVVAAAGTDVVRRVLLAEVTVAFTPLNRTVLLAAVALKPEPSMVTLVPTAPLTGSKPVTANWPLPTRRTWRILPTES